MSEFVEIRIALAAPTRRGPKHVTAKAFVPDLLASLDYTPGSSTQARLAIAGERVSRVDARASASPVGFTQILGLLARSEGIGSSTIEGYNASLERIVVESAMDPRPHTTTTAGIIRDGIEAVSFALSSLGDSDQPLTVDAIEAVQRRLLANQAAHLRGLRKVYVQIGGSPQSPETADFIPPPHDRVPGLMSDLCGFVNRDDFLHPIARAAIAHAQFETIHPFPDGNGRTGRALLQAMLRRDGLMKNTVLPVSAAIAQSDASRQRYVRALGGVRGVHSELDATVEAFCEFISDAAERTSVLIADVEAAVARLRSSARERFRADSSALDMVDLLVAHVGVSAPAAASHLGVSPQRARAALDGLQSAGLVSSRAGGRSGRIYFAPSVLAVVAEASGASANVSHHDAPPSDSALAPWSVLTGPGSGRPRAGERCGQPLRNGGVCMRRAGHGTTGHRSTP